ncbi:hypothetical protein SAMN04488577_1036 [Bacillus sp. cl95]|nr:hypothetical protein SAMN02799634_101761 [Bacillus sp. UNCCL13]SFQ68421.1 hypothetical protein SAMN04488577_1036 [Bacillus sp. cl95]
MRRLPLIIILSLIIFSFVLNLLGLMHLIPLFISAPLLFLSFLILVTFFNNRKKFKGF